MRIFTSYIKSIQAKKCSADQPGSRRHTGIPNMFYLRYRTSPDQMQIGKLQETAGFPQGKKIGENIASCSKNL
ncbi:MAG: hypothetical protein B5M56_00485 [Desulfococcus sp. 4484_241]|nr:MAG: hypothetical protein B5M56_00485 [Desulfococcus sp. 4484_241]